jgi:hypothetical protein
MSMPVAHPIRQVCLASAALAVLLAACTTGLLPPPYNPVAHQNAVQMKVDTLALIDKSGQRYAASQAAVEALTARYAGAYEAASKNPSDASVAQAWQIVRGANTGSAGEYFETWKKRTTMRPAIRAEKKAQIGRHFDYIICLEAAKQGGPACVSPLAAAPTAPPAPAPEVPAEGEQ